MSRYIDLDKIQFFTGVDAETGEEVMLATMNQIEELPTADVVEIPEGGIGNLSDGYHTFNELYHHRAILFSVICNAMPDKAWKSKLHDTGDMFDGMFIVGIETPEGQATYHYDIDPHWDMFKVKELEKAPKWDGHTPQIAIDRIAKLSADVVEVRHGEWLDRTRIIAGQRDYCFECSKCGYIYWYQIPFSFYYCAHCGAKMDGERKEENAKKG